MLKSVSPMNPTVSQGVRFLRMLEDEGLGFGAVNTARCALSVILPRINGQSFGKSYPVHLFMRALHNRNPPKSRYSRFWDVAIVFDYLRSLPNNKHLSVMQLGFKVLILLLLVTGHRGQTMVALSLDNIHIHDDEIVFDLNTLLKSNRLGDTCSTVAVQTFPSERKLCVVSAIRNYISKTSEIRSSSQLFVSYIKPHGAVSRDTIARWTLRILQQSGVDIKEYTAHSTRGAMASNARLLGISVHKILKHAGWKTQRSFARHYNKRVQKRPKLADKLLRK